MIQLDTQVVLGQVTTQGRIRPQEQVRFKDSDLTYRYENIHGDGAIVPINTKVYGHFETIHGIETFIVTYYEKNRIGKNKMKK